MCVHVCVRVCVCRCQGRVGAWGSRARRLCCISVCSLFSPRLHGDGSSCSILGLGLAERGGPPARLPARPPAQPWELPALRPPAAHRPCQPGRKKACLLTPSTRLPGYRGSAQKMSGRGYWEVGLQPGCLQSRENSPWPAAALACQHPGESSRPNCTAAGSHWRGRGPGKAPSEVSHARPTVPSQNLQNIPGLCAPSIPSFPEGFPDRSALRGLVTALTLGAMNDQSSQGHQELQSWRRPRRRLSAVVPMYRWRKRGRGWELRAAGRLAKITERIMGVQGRPPAQAVLWQHAFLFGPSQDWPWPWPEFPEVVGPFLLPSPSPFFSSLLSPSRHLSVSLLPSCWFSREAWALCAMSVSVGVYVCVWPLGSEGCFSSHLPLSIQPRVRPLINKLPKTESETSEPRARRP